MALCNLCRYEYCIFLSVLIFIFILPSQLKTIFARDSDSREESVSVGRNSHSTRSTSQLEIRLFTPHTTHSIPYSARTLPPPPPLQLDSSRAHTLAASGNVNPSKYWRGAAVGGGCIIKGLREAIQARLYIFSARLAHFDVFHAVNNRSALLSSTG